MIDVDEYRLQPDSLAEIKPKKATNRKKGHFVKGPICTEWLSIAGNLPGKTLQVGLALWLAKGVERKARFKFTPKWYGMFELSPATVSRSLQRLRESGLIRVENRPGRAPVVTMLDVAEDLL